MKTSRKQKFVLSSFCYFCYSLSTIVKISKNAVCTIVLSLLYFLFSVDSVLMFITVSRSSEYTSVKAGSCFPPHCAASVDFQFFPPELYTAVTCFVFRQNSIRQSDVPVVSHHTVRPSPVSRCLSPRLSSSWFSDGNIVNEYIVA